MQYAPITKEAEVKYLLSIPESAIPFHSGQQQKLQGADYHDLSDSPELRDIWLSTLSYQNRLLCRFLLYILFLGDL